MLTSVQIPARTLSGRLLAIRAKRGQQDYWFCAVYAPPFQRQLSEGATKVFGQISEWMAKLPERANPVVAGDMNGRTGSIQNGPGKKLVSSVSSTVGSFSPEDENEQGCAMRKMLENFNMVAVI